MNISDFNKPDHHPFNTFGTYEREAFMAWFLSQCIKANDLYAEIKTSQNEDEMVTDGFLEKTGKQTYKMTKKSAGLLFSAYGK